VNTKTKTKAETNKLQTLERGIRALEEVAVSAEGLSIADLAERLGVARAITYRIVATLEDHAMIQRRPDGKIVLGSGTLAMAAQFDANLRVHARPLVEALAEEVGATAFLSVASGEDCVAVLVAEPSTRSFNINYRVGSRHPLARGAAGIAILSARPFDAGEREAVGVAREQGYSITRGELQPGAIGVACTVPLSRELHPGLESSLGVVAMEDLDTPHAIACVKKQAEALARLMDGDIAEGSPVGKVRGKQH